MEQTRQCHILEPDPRRRNLVYQVASAAGFSTHPYENLTELEFRPPTDGFLLAATVGRLAHQAMEVLDGKEIWLPLIGYGSEPTGVESVRAVIDGMAGYLQWPFDAESLTDAAGLASCLRPWGLNEEFSCGKLRGPSAERLIATLTPREGEVLNLITEGYSSYEAGKVLGISFRTVEIHRASISRKLGARRIADVTRIALEAKFAKENYKRPLAWRNLSQNSERNAA